LGKGRWIYLSDRRRSSNVSQKEELMILEAKYWNQELNRQKIDFVNAAE